MRCLLLQRRLVSVDMVPVHALVYLECTCLTGKAEELKTYKITQAGVLGISIRPLHHSTVPPSRSADKHTEANNLRKLLVARNLLTGRPHQEFLRSWHPQRERRPGVSSQMALYTSCCLHLTKRSIPQPALSSAAAIEHR